MKRSIFCVFLLALCFGPALAQIQELAELDGVNLPFALKSETVLLEKGKYDFILLRNVPNVFLLKIKKQGKTIGLISGGEKINYPDQGNLNLLQSNPDIPKFAKLTIKRDRTRKIADIILETGKHASGCPFHKIRFRFECVE
jgi:hypothetical protein